MSEATIAFELFKAIEKESNIHLHPSNIPIPIEDNSGKFLGFYAFHGSGAVRIEISGEDVVGVAVWNRPGDLNKPDYHASLRGIDAQGEVDTISKLMSGRGGALVPTKDYKESTRLQEAAAEDVDKFFKSIGGYAYDKPISDLYTSYEQWAGIHDKKQISASYFHILAKEWLIKNGHYANLEITKGNIEKTEIPDPAQEDTLTQDVLNNQILYKVSLAEHAVQRMAKNDPLINALFIYGTAGMGKTTLVKKNLKDVWDRVVYKSGAVAGFTGLLQLLWNYRKGKIIVLDDNDNLIRSKSLKDQTINILKAALNTEESGRVISYTRMKRK